MIDTIRRRLSSEFLACARLDLLIRVRSGDLKRCRYRDNVSAKLNVYRDSDLAVTAHVAGLSGRRIKLVRQQCPVNVIRPVSFGATSYAHHPSVERALEHHW